MSPFAVLSLSPRERTGFIRVNTDDLRSYPNLRPRHTKRRRRGIAFGRGESGSLIWNLNVPNPGVGWFGLSTPNQRIGMGGS